jgi:hypothetical protein
MTDDELRRELDGLVMKVVNNFTGRPINQEFITSVWAAVFDEVKFFNDERLKMSKEAVEYIHAYYINTGIKISSQSSTYTIGQLTTQEYPPSLSDVRLIELYRMRKMFENTVLESVIVTEIQSRLENGSTKEQTSRSGQRTSN